MSRFVTPTEVRLPISDGDYLIVKERLNLGDATERTARMLNAEGTAVDPLKYGRAQVQTYLVDWSLTDAAGRIVSIREEPPAVVAAALENLDPEDFREILEAIEAHEQRMTAAREEKKSTRSGATVPAAISPSLVAVGGGMSGSRS